MNISGNFNTKERERRVVRELLDMRGINYDDVIECIDPDAGDVVILSGGKEIIVEVKEEEYETRFKHYGDLGIDLISTFQFASAADRQKWRGVLPCGRFNEMYATIDKTRGFKWGKLMYSKSHIWLFFVMRGNEYHYAEFFDGNGIKSDGFKAYLKRNCKFAVNNKPQSQCSYNDGFQSAAIFVNSNDRELNKHRINDLNRFIAVL